MSKLRLLDLFSGIGGFSLGLERSGFFHTVAFCEIEPFPRRVLKKHWPDIPIYEDVRTLTADALRRDGIGVDAICGGFPCQDVSEASVNGLGLDGEKSGLWSEYARLICALRPRFVIVENVARLLGRGIDRVLRDISAIGYDAEWRVIRACDVGRQHERARVWILAYPHADCRGPILSEECFAREICLLAERQKSASRYQGIPEISWDSPWPSVVDHLGSLADGLPGRLDGWNGLGNAVVPQIPEIIGRAIGAAMLEPA